MIHNDCHRSIINKIFEFYKLQKSEDEDNPDTNKNTKELISIASENKLAVHENYMFTFQNK